MEVITEACRFCNRDIPDYSILTHEAHCERGRRIMHGLPVSPEPPRSPSPVVEEPSESSAATAADAADVTTIDPDLEFDKDSITGEFTTDDFAPDNDDAYNRRNTIKLQPNVTYIPIQLPEETPTDDNWKPSWNIRSNTRQSPERTPTNSPKTVYNGYNGYKSNGTTTANDLSKNAYEDNDLWKTDRTKNDFNTSESKMDTGSKKPVSNYDLNDLSRPSTSHDYVPFDNFFNTSRNGSQNSVISLGKHEGFWDATGTKPAADEIKTKTNEGSSFDTRADPVSSSNLGEDRFTSSVPAGSSTDIGKNRLSSPSSSLEEDRVSSSTNDDKIGSSDRSGMIDPKETITTSLTRDLEKPAGVNCPDCRRLQKAGGLRKHMEQDCPMRNTKCSFCDGAYFARDLETHMVVCGTKSERCPECEEMIMLKYKHIHLESNHGFIKLDDEPENLTAWAPLPRIPVRPPDIIRNVPLSTKPEDSRVEIPCEFCDQIFPAYRLTVHQLGCRLKQQTTAKTTSKTEAHPETTRRINETTNNTSIFEPITLNKHNTTTTNPIIANSTSYDYPRHLSPIPPVRKHRVVHIPILQHAKTAPILNSNRPSNFIPNLRSSPIFNSGHRSTSVSPNVEVMNFGKVLGVSPTDKFKRDWMDLERRIRCNSGDSGSTTAGDHVIPCEYCSKMLKIGEVMSHQMMCFLQH